MEGGFDIEERASSEQQQHNEKTRPAGDSEEENKFQKAIGAWRSRAFQYLGESGDNTG